MLHFNLAPPRGILATMLLLFCAIFFVPSLLAASSRSCTSTPPTDISRLAFSPSSLLCQKIWSEYGYDLRYSFNKSSNVLSILLSANQVNNWIAIGFSPNGYMIGSSAMVGYLAVNGTGIMKQYHLKGKTPDFVIPDEGELNLVKGTELIAVKSLMTYLAFQLNMSNSRAISRNLVLAFGYPGILPDLQTNQLQIHRDQLQVTFDFGTGVSITSSNTAKLRRNHGIINIFAWGVFAPIGVIVARYFRQWDPEWFYFHMGFQLISYLLAIIGVALGVRLAQRLPGVAVHTHRALGISILVLGSLQVLALVLRPGKEAKIRKYWNWYHHFVGRLALLLAATNIFVGINLAHAASSWKVGYIFVLVCTLVVVVALESLYWYKRFKQPTVLVPPRTGFSAFSDI